MSRIKQQLAKMEQATKHLKAQPFLMPDEVLPFLEWCDTDSLIALVKLDNKEAGELLLHSSDELKELLVLHGDEVLSCSDDELMQNADEQTKQTILANRRELAKWRGFYANHKPKSLAEWLRSDDQEMSYLAQHFNKQLADFRVIRKARF